MKILVAEDDPTIAESYRLILKASGHDVVITKDGEECLDVFKKNGSGPFDLIILDYRMPRKNGVEVAVQVRSEAPAQRILLATAFAHDLSIAELHKNAATQSVELIQKPFELDHFLSVIEEAKHQVPGDAHGSGRNNDKGASKLSSQVLPSGTAGDLDDQKYGLSSMQGDDDFAGNIFGIWK